MKNSTKKSLIYYGFVSTILIAFVILLNCLIESNPDSGSQTSTQIWLTRLGLIALVFTIFGAIEASRAQRKSDTILDDLIKMGFLNAPRESFEDIFNYDLIPNLQKMQSSTDGQVYLLLSTPAYGYPVVKPETYRNYKDSIFALREKSIQFMFFCPDAHFDYWSNVLLWSISNADNNYAINFAIEIYKMLDEIEGNQSWKVWIKKEVTIRLYGFGFQSATYTSHIADSKSNFDKVFICFVDTFSIALSQFETSQARHMQIHPRSIDEYVHDKGSFFEKAKQCPYTLLPERAEVSKENYKLLIADYIFGLTSEKKFESFEWFKNQFVLFFDHLMNTLRTKDLLNGRTDDQIKQDILDIMINYYKKIIELFINDEFLSLENYLIKHMVTFDAIQADLVTILGQTKTDEFFSIIAKIPNQVRQTPAYTQMVTDKQAEKTTLAAGNNLVVVIIFLLISSGFGESSYYKRITTP